MSDLEASLKGWDPDPVTSSDALSPDPALALAAVLETPRPFLVDGELPPLWHWVYFLDWPAHGDLGADGHPAHGRFLPPVPNRRRMFAGGRLTITRPLRVDGVAERTSSLSHVAVKRGRSGEMVFVTVRSEFRQEGGLRMVEEQDYVYRSGESETRSSYATAPRQWPEAAAAWQQRFTGDSVRLFRFSALTANAHRIHYDEPYAREVERYPGLVVHGPLLAMLMTELARRNRAESPISTVDYRLRRPVFAGTPTLVTGTPDEDSAEMTVLSAPDTVVAQAKVGFA
ncbi:3-methylfumaryl-CoA hydratase [Saccharopolyspora lacisalsi]|uniref:3-methylfumaryl-CoA hydratase n=1 Tax=Halosaccharopolyspora lacisalsi TaxID=1000566 RepID=A0A839DXT7_9PSEU|nr:MaoC family dehydratase N-terminal domain-containing protein [Halosaccharopolyspora lacisalsi]MBA8826304.1 3-methylfumaryl-CoA hydratase [Halosaccharopolyspora lacisalsi]